MNLVISKSNVAFNIKSTALFLMLFFITVGPTIPSLGVAGDMIVITSIFSIILLLGTIRKIKLFHEIKLALLLTSVFVFYSFITTLLNGAGDITYLLRGARILINIFGVLSLVYLYYIHYNKIFLDKLLVFLYFILTLHGIIMLLEFASPAFRGFVYNFTEPGIIEDNMRYRMAGLTNGGGAGTSIIQFIPILMTPLISKILDISFFNKMMFGLFVLINIAAMVVSGRTGIVLMLIFFPILYLWDKSYFFSLRFKKDNIIKCIIKIILLISIILISFNTGIFKKLSSYEYGEKIVLSVDRTMREFRNLSETGNFKTVDILSNQLHIPSEINVLIIGNSINKRDNSKSDIGYIRDLHGVGILGVILTLFFYFFIIITSLYHKKKYSSLVKFIVIFNLSLIFIHIKEPFLFTRYFLTVTIVTFSGLILYINTTNFRRFKNNDQS
jgi:hypothetical protein